jgi:hypothetical protein
MHFSCYFYLCAKKIYQELASNPEILLSIMLWGNEYICCGWRLTHYLCSDDQMLALFFVILILKWQHAVPRSWWHKVADVSHLMLLFKCLTKYGSRNVVIYMQEVNVCVLCQVFFRVAYLLVPWGHTRKPSTNLNVTPRNKWTDCSQNELSFTSGTLDTREVTYNPKCFGVLTVEVSCIW